MSSPNDGRSAQRRGAFGNRYENVLSSGGSLQNNRATTLAAIGHAYSDRTQFNFSAVYSHYTATLPASDSVTTTLGVVHQFSPRLTISASVGELLERHRGHADDARLSDDADSLRQRTCAAGSYHHR